MTWTAVESSALQAAGYAESQALLYPVSYTHLTLPTNREV